MNFIMDNLIAEGKCREMLVVMTCGYAFKPGEDPVFYPGDFDGELVNDVIPYIDAHFSTKKGVATGQWQVFLLDQRRRPLLWQNTHSYFRHLEFFGSFLRTVKYDIE